jgi:hypothetical protein
VSSDDAVFRRLQAAARSAAANSGTGAPTQEYLVRHTLESFLDRLTRTPHAGDFVLEGGILLAAYGIRRPTKDTDANAVGADVTAEHLADVVRDIAAIGIADGARLHGQAGVLGSDVRGGHTGGVHRRRVRRHDTCTYLAVAGWCAGLRRRPRVWGLGQSRRQT